MNQNFIDMLAAFSRNDVEYLLVGAYAVATYGFQRMTADIDLWINPTPENSPKVFQSLKDFGAPLFGSKPDSFTKENQILQIGVEPWRIDIITSIDGLNFKEAWQNRVKWVVGDGFFWVISKSDLIKNKRASGRRKDLIDLDFLENGPEEE